jgi:hypothetical protein
MKRILALACVVAFSGSGLVIVGSAPAQAVGCDPLSVSYVSPTITVHATCSAGWIGRGWLRYYTSDNTNAQLITKYTDWIRSGSASASRPSGSIYHSKGAAETQG